jgi:hypothetical protein
MKYLKTVKLNERFCPQKTFEETTIIKEIKVKKHKNK